MLQLTLPLDPALWLTARNEAQAASQQRVAAMMQAAQATEQANLDAQLAAARLRLIRELARNLRCMGHADLSKLFQQQLQAKTASSERFRTAFVKLGGPPPWSLWDDKDASAYVDELTDGQRQQRVNLASELKAALNDPRWLARKATGV